MNKGDLVAAVAKKAELSKKDAALPSAETLRRL